MLNYTPIQGQWNHPTLQDLDVWNQWEEGTHVFLTSNDDVQTRPPWLEGEKNVPRKETKTQRVEEPWADWDGRVDGEIPGDTAENRAEWFDVSLLEHDREREDNAHEAIRQDLRKRYGGKEMKEGSGGRSDAPAILLVIYRGNGVVDAFWFYFYSFNLGNTVANIRFGNHIGDWEHCLVRFHNGMAKALFFSAHQGGEAYSYEAVQKNRTAGKSVTQGTLKVRNSQTTLKSAACHLLRRGKPCDVRHPRRS